MISEKGYLRDIPSIKLLLKIFESALTGILYLKKEAVLKVLYFYNGRLIWAISNSVKDKIENILTKKQLIDEVTLGMIQQELTTGESIGKALVERGLITLEELVDSTKEQLKGIISSILKWDNGGYQFVKDTPPERLLSLDLNVTEYVMNYIIEELELEAVWKAIGSMQTVYQINPDQEKVAKFNLTDRQKEFLHSFDGQGNLEEILSKYSGSNRESLLKLVYYFLVSDLLIKNEITLPPLAENPAVDDGGVDNGFDQEFNFPPIPGLESVDTGEAQEEPLPVSEQPAREQEPDFVMGKQEEERVVASEPPPPPAPAKPASDIHTMVYTEKKSRRQFNIIMLAVIVIFVLAGVIFLMLLPEKKKPVLPVTADPMGQHQVKATETVSEKPLAQKKQSQAPIEVDMKRETPDLGEKKKEIPVRKENIREPERAETKDSPVKEVKKPDPKPVVAGKSPLDYFKEGNFLTAADLWQRELAAAHIKYTILLELDCMKESVVNAFNHLDNKREFFIITKKRDQRICFLVLWGKFTSREDATVALKMIPQYFWKQQNPPEVYEIRPQR